MRGIETIAVAAADGVHAVFTTRRGGYGSGPFAGANLGATSGDDLEVVRSNRRAMSSGLAVDPSRVVMCHQVHGASVRATVGPERPDLFTDGLVGWPESDGLATRAAGVPLMVLAADCMPVLLWRTDGSAVAAVHAGWRGLLGGVVAAGVASLGAGSQVAAAVGPCAGRCCYEVDDELRGRFVDRFGSNVVNGRAVDLAAGALAELGDAGVASEAVHVDGSCTICDAERFFSYRRDGARTGRQAGVIWREER